MPEEIAPQQKERSAFLTLLCVLTFVSVPLFITLNAEGWFMLRSTSAEIDRAIAMADSMHMSGDQGINKQIQEAQNGILMATIFLIVNAVFALFCLWGALLMWRSKKAGYFIYLAGEIVPLIVGAFTIQNSPLESVLMYLLPLMAVSALTFIVLYGLHLKEMN